MTVDYQIINCYPRYFIVIWRLLRSCHQALELSQRPAGLAALHYFFDKFRFKTNFKVAEFDPLLFKAHRQGCDLAMARPKSPDFSDRFRKLGLFPPGPRSDLPEFAVTKNPWTQSQFFGNCLGRVRKPQVLADIVA